MGHRRRLLGYRIRSRWDAQDRRPRGWKTTAENEGSGSEGTSRKGLRTLKAAAVSSSRRCQVTWDRRRSRSCGFCVGRLMTGALPSFFSGGYPAQGQTVPRIHHHQIIHHRHEMLTLTGRPRQA